MKRLYVVCDLGGLGGRKGGREGRREGRRIRGRVRQNKVSTRAS